MGVLESRQGGRYTVTDLSPSRLVAPFNVMLSVAEYDVDEHFECRARSSMSNSSASAPTARRPRSGTRILKLAVDGTAFLTDPVAFRLLDYRIPSGAERRRATTRLLATRGAGPLRRRRSTCAASPAPCPA